MEERLYSTLFDSNSTKISLFRIGNTQYVRKQVKGIVASYLCNREVEILERCRGVNGVQQIIEQDSDTSFISEYIEGTSLLDTKNLDSQYFNKLRKILESIHQVGVADIDFGHSRDLLVKPDGNPAVIDLAASVIYNQDDKSLIRKFAFNYVKDLNYKYIIKRQAKFLPDSLTPEEKIIAMNVGVLPKIWSKVRKGSRFIRKNLQD